MKKIIALSFISVGYFLNAQSLGNSPYAAYGIGDVKFDNTLETSSMGGISTAYINDFTSSFNFANPANNANLELTSIKVEATNENNYFKTNYDNTKVTKHSTYLSNISLAFPLSPKLKMGISYQPYSSKSYDITHELRDENDAITKVNHFTGSGTLNILQAALGYKINSELAVGAKMNYYFGNLSDKDEFTVAGAELINGYESTNKINNFNLTLGASYQKLMKMDHKLTFGATATFGNTKNPSTQYTNSTYYLDSNGNKVGETIIEQVNSKTKNLLPFQASIGAGYGEENRWFFSGQLDYKKAQDVYYFGQLMDMQDSYRIAAGGWWLPNYNNFRNYFSRVVYRGGLYYEKGSLKIGDKTINEMGVTVGALFPFKSSSVTRMSGLELGVEFGKRGTTQNNLINQNFINLKVGLNFADKWFRKQLYN